MSVPEAGGHHPEAGDLRIASDGKVYRVQPDGSWRRLTGEAAIAARQLYDQQQERRLRLGVAFAAALSAQR